jgi:hypothetical protein
MFWEAAQQQAEFRQNSTKPTLSGPLRLHTHTATYSDIPTTLIITSRTSTHTQTQAQAKTLLFGSPELGDLGLIQAHTLLDHRLDLGVRVHVMHRVGEEQLAQRPRLVLRQAGVEGLVLLPRLLCWRSQWMHTKIALQANENHRTAKTVKYSQSLTSIKDRDA